MEIKITAEPIAWVPLTDLEVDILVTCSQLHYDVLCRRAGELGGFIFGWKNSTRWAVEQGGPVPEQKVTLRDIDHCLKILEVQPPTQDSMVQQQHNDLRARFWLLTKELASASKNWICTTTWS